MFDSRTKARSLAFLFGGGATVGLLTLLLPHQQEVNELAGSLCAVVAALIAAWLAWRPQRLPDALIHAVLALGTLLLSVAIHYLHEDTLYPLIYSWPVLYAFYFFSTPAALAHLALVGVSYATVLAIDDATDVGVRLVLVLGTPLVVGLLVSRLLGRLRAGFTLIGRQAEALRAGEQRTRLLIESAQDGFASTDADGRVLDLNAAAEQLLGWPRAEALGRTFDEIALPWGAKAEYEQRLARIVAAARNPGAHMSLETEIRRQDGSRIPVDLIIWPVERDGETILNVRFTDIRPRLRKAGEREELVRAEARRVAAERSAATVSRLQAVVDAALAHRDLADLVPALLARVREVLDADGAALLLAEEDGTLSLHASDESTTPSRPERVARTAGLAGRVLAEGAPVLVHDPTPDDLADPGILSAGIRSLLGVPLVARGETIGVLEVGVRPPRRLGDDDADLLRLTADRVALALDHARAYGREHRIAETLQRSLLPEALPDVPGLALSARYLPAASEAEVGGDWYDAIALPGAHVLLVMGDVSGKGLAAAGTLGTLRNAIRAYALEGHGPAEIAERLNRLVLSDPARAHMATLVLADVDPVEARVRWVNAGHPPPLVLDAAGAPVFLDGSRSVPLGVMPFPSYHENAAALEPGGAMVLYTDGLFERRGVHVDDGLKLVAQAAGAGPLDPDALCDRLLAGAAGIAATEDDVALLALRHVPFGDRLAMELPSDPQALASLRALVRRWLGQHDAGDRDVHAITMACSEACTNAIEHAGAGRATPISFEAVLRGGEVEIHVRDRGRWRDERPSDQGRGLDLMGALMDAVDVQAHEGGTTVRLRRRLTQAVKV